MATNGSLPPNLPSDNRTGLLIGVSVMMIAIATVLVVLRLYVRKMVTNALGADDFVTVAALVSPPWH
jgi:hypothetical protein